MEAQEDNAGRNEIAGRFVLTAELERRPAATIYKATDKVLGGREVVVKIFNDSASGRDDIAKSYEDEVNKLRAASHPSLVPIIAGGVDQGKLYIAMEFIDGRSLKSLLKEQNGPLATEAATTVAAELAAGLKELHEQGIVHGHLDSRAILFKGEEPRLAGYVPKAIDLLQKQSTSAGRMVAEAYYIAPEQLSSSEPIDGRADIYSLSTLLYEMVTGQRPFNSPNPMQAAMQRLTENPTPPTKVNPNVSPLLEAALLKGLARDPKNRFPTCAEFTEALNAASGVTKNPFAAMAAQSPERMTTSTIAVSMSADAIREMLKKQEPTSAPAAANSSASSAPSAGKSEAKVGGDVTSTAMGMKAVNVPSASLLILNGANRGKKVSAAKTQLMIGSDPGCDLVIDQKGIPSRYALVLQRENDYFIAPLSATAVKVNGEAIKGEEHKLQRGDIIDVGTDQVRFIAPGEVFTLREDVADRVIDRPKSKIGNYLLIGALVIAGLSFGAFYLFQQKREAAQLAKARAEASRVKDRDVKINSLRAQGDEFLKQGALREPPGANAYDRFQEILEYNPEDSYAKRRISEIDERLARLQQDDARKQQLAARLAELKADGERYFSAKQYMSPPGRNAREVYQEILKIDPADQDARGKIAEIDKLMGDMLGRVREMLATAKGYKEAGQYVDPPGQNAYELVRNVLDVDPKNVDAKEMLADMAAMSVYRGNDAKRHVKMADMRRAYLTAESLGVDPTYTDMLMKGTDIMKRSRGGGVIIVDTGEKDLPKDDSRYLPTSDIHRRASRIQRDAEAGIKPGERVYIEIDR